MALVKNYGPRSPFLVALGQAGFHLDQTVVEHADLDGHRLGAGAALHDADLFAAHGGDGLDGHGEDGREVGDDDLRAAADADPNLAEWVLGWMMGLYARRREMIVPRAVMPPEHSLSHLIRGRIVYHGELWIDKHCKVGFPVFPRIGMLLAMVKWQPEAIWALRSEEHT